jgi:hypothetical protein
MTGSATQGQKMAWEESAYVHGAPYPKNSRSAQCGHLGQGQASRLWDDGHFQTHLRWPPSHPQKLHRTVWFALHLKGI